MDPEEQSDLGLHCLPVCKNRFEKFARIFSRRHKQTTFSDADFLGALRVNHLQTVRTVYDVSTQKSAVVVIKEIHRFLRTVF